MRRDAIVTATCMVVTGLMAGFLFLVWFAQPADAADHQAYAACDLDNGDPRYCVWDGRHNDSDILSRSWWVSSTKQHWRLPHGLAHYLATGEGRTEWLPCGAEDARSCVWDARHQGNGLGQSTYTANDGRVFPIPHHIAHYLVNG